jgi:hypothetical protein
VTLADDILGLLEAHPEGLSDAEIARALGKLHQHVNQTCARLAQRRLLVRDDATRPIRNRRPGVRAMTAHPPGRPAPHPSPSTPTPELVSSEVEAKTWLGRTFRVVGPLVLARSTDGEPIHFLPQAEYANLKGKQLNAHGAGPFCRFALAGARAEPGVYVLTENRRPVYVGICQDLWKRWGPVGYGSISPVNCYVGGQSTNCKVNSRVLAGSLRGAIYEVWFHRLGSGQRAIEVEMIRSLRPPWNGTS